MTPISRYDELVTRNRFCRKRDLAFALFLVVMTALAVGSIGSADDSARSARHACAATTPAC